MTPKTAAICSIAMVGLSVALSLAIVGLGSKVKAWGVEQKTREDVSKRLMNGEVQLVRQLPDGRNVYRLWDAQTLTVVYVTSNGDTEWAKRQISSKQVGTPNWVTVPCRTTEAR